MIAGRRRGRWGFLDMIEAFQGDWRLEFTDGACDCELEQLLDVLTPREREVVLLRAGSYKHREIALLLGISKNSVNTLLARALKKLQSAAKRNQPARSAQRAEQKLQRPLQ